MFRYVLRILNGFLLNGRLVILGDMAAVKTARAVALTVPGLDQET